MFLHTKYYKSYLPNKKLLTLFFHHNIILEVFGRLAQLGEHPLDVRKVTGPIPVAPTIINQSL